VYALYIRDNMMHYVVHLHTKLLTCRSVLHENVTVTWVVTEIWFTELKRFITTFPGPHHWIPFCARRIQSTSSHLISLRTILISSYHVCTVESWCSGFHPFMITHLNTTVQPFVISSGKIGWYCVWQVGFLCCPAILQITLSSMSVFH
jgi:hypothetical protein